MTQEYIRKMHQFAMRETLKRFFDREELDQKTWLEPNVSRKHQAIVLKYDEGFEPTKRSHPDLPLPTFRLRTHGGIVFVYMLLIPAFRPSDGEEASQEWNHYERCRKHLMNLTRAKGTSQYFPNPCLEYEAVLNYHDHSYLLGELYGAYCKIAATNKAQGKVTGGKARGAQKTREVEHTTIPKLELAIRELGERGAKITKKAISEESGISVSTVKRHWNKPRLLSLREEFS